MLKTAKFSALCLFIIVGCFQNNFENKAVIKVREKAINRATEKAFKEIKNLNIEKFRHLVNKHEAQLDSTEPNKEGETMLAMACKLGFIEAVEIMLKIPKFKESINVPTRREGYTPLMLAVKLFPYSEKIFKLIKLLIVDNKANVRLRNFSGSSAFTIALEAKAHAERELPIEDIAKLYANEVVELLKAQKSAPEDLLLACITDKDKPFERCFTKAIEQFKEKNKLDFIDSDEALMLAIKSEHLGKVEILLNVFGANQNVRMGNEGNTAMHLACIKFVNLKHDNIFKLGNLLKIIKQLYKQRKIDDKIVWGRLEIENAKGETPIGIYFSALTHLDIYLQKTLKKLYLLKDSERYTLEFHQEILKELDLLKERAQYKLRGYLEGYPTAICTFLSMLNCQKNILINIKMKRIKEEPSLEAAAAAKETPIRVIPIDSEEAAAAAKETPIRIVPIDSEEAAAAAKETPIRIVPIDSEFEKIGGQLIYINFEEAGLHRFFKRFLDGGAWHIESVDCSCCKIIRSMKILNIIIEIA